MKRHVQMDVNGDDPARRQRLAGQYELLEALLAGTLDTLCKSTLNVSLTDIREFENYM